MMNTDITKGHTGAKVQSWNDANPREKLRQLIEQNPGADEVALQSMLRDFLISDDGYDYLMTVIEYWFTNNYRSLVSVTVTHTERTTVKAERRQRQAEAVEKVKATIVANVVLGAMTMPNGKELRDCTGDECGQFGGWLLKVGEKVGSAKVGDVLSEDDLKSLLG